MSSYLDRLLIESFLVNAFCSKCGFLLPVGGWTNDNGTPENPGKPLCAECYAIVEVERRGGGEELKELIRETLSPDETTCYTDEIQPSGASFGWVQR